MKPISAQSPLILASTSVYRRELLARLRLPFETMAPGTDETPDPKEMPEQMAPRLALEKAQAVSRLKPGRWVLGSDQVPSLDGVTLGKPGSRDNARLQLRQFSGRSVQFHTALALTDGQRNFVETDLTTVHFRTLEDAEIERYLEAEPAYDCAGSFKCEGLGITLFRSIENRDPTALVGLPLIALRRLLLQAGVELP